VPNIRFLTLAETEIDDAVFWYQKQSVDESLNFLAELNRALQVILTYPFIAAEVEPGIHSFLFRRFPYSLWR
jgi:plasmid stabilization system protein ParE